MRIYALQHRAAICKWIGELKLTRTMGYICARKICHKLSKATNMAIYMAWLMYELMLKKKRGFYAPYVIKLTPKCILFHWHRSASLSKKRVLSFYIPGSGC